MSDRDDDNFGLTPTDSYTEVETKSWFSRIGSSLSGLLLGPLAILCAIGLLFWNEGRAVETARSLAEGAGAVVSISAAKIDPANEGRLVHVTGPIVAVGAPRDVATGVEAEGLRLIRKVGVFQWRENSKSETRKKLGGGEETVTVWSYARGWTDQPNDGAAFKHPEGHRNPPTPLAGETIAVSEARLGAFRLSGAQIGSLGRARPLPVSDFDRGALRRALGGSAAGQPVEGHIFVGVDPAQPRLGDLRISYEIASTPEASVVARQTGSSLAPYVTAGGRTIEILRDGPVGAAQIFADAQSANTTMTWLVRVGGVLLLSFGFGLILGPLAVIADVVPFIGDLVGGASSIVAFAAATLVGSATIAVAWFAYRPLLSVGLIVAGVAIAGLLRRFAPRRPTIAAAT